MFKSIVLINGNKNTEATLILMMCDKMYKCLVVRIVHNKTEASLTLNSLICLNNPILHN